MTLAGALARVLVGLAGVTAAGWAVSRTVVSGGMTRREKFAWALASGLLLQSAGLVALLALRIRPTGAGLLILEALAAGLALLAAAYRPGRERRPASRAAARPGGPAWLSAALFAVAAAAWLVFALESLGDGMWATDFLAFWGYKGKIVYLTSEISRRLFQDPALYFAHREYPLLVPLSLASLAAFIGRWNDEALALLYPACALATLCALSGFLERRVSRLAGASAAALAALCAFLYKAGNAGTAEIPFALSLVLAASAAIDWLERDSESSAWRLALASLFCATLKQEGSLFVLLLAAVVWLRMRRTGNRGRLGATGLVALAAPALAHWLLLFALRGNQTRRDFDFTLFEPDRWKELPALFALVAGRFVRIGWTEALVPIGAIVVFFLITRRGVGEPFLPLFPAQIFFYAVAFTVSSFDPLYAIDGAFRRITMTLFPAFTLVLCSREIR